MKKIIIIAIAVILIIGLAVGGISLLNTPKNVALRSLKGFAEDIVEREEISPFVDTLNGGSIRASLNSMVRKDNDGAVQLLEGTSIDGKIYLSNNGIMLDEFKSKINGTKISGSAYISRDLIYVEEEQILKDTYGIQLSTLVEELKASIFAPSSNSDYALDEETFDEIISALENINDARGMEEDAKGLIEKVTEDIINIIFDYAEIESENTEVRIGGAKTKVRQITIKIDSYAMQDIVKEIYDYLCESEDIVNFIAKYQDVIIYALGDLYDEGEHFSLAAAYKDALEEFEDTLDDICDSIDEDFEDLTIKIATPKRSAKLLKLEVEFGKDTVLVIDCGEKGIKKTDSVKIELLEEIEISYKVSKSDRNNFEAKLTIEGDSPEIELILSIDKSKGNYTISCAEKSAYSNYSDKYTVKGSWSKKGDTFELTVDRIINKWTYDEDSYQYTYELECAITMDTDDKMPALISDFKRVSDIKEKDIEKLLERLEEAS